MTKRGFKSITVMVLVVLLFTVLNCYASLELSDLEKSINQTVFSQGEYYVNNKDTGHYLRYNSSLSAESGLLTNLQSTVKWYFAETQGNITIHPSSASGDMYLALSSSGNSVEVISTNYREFPERCYWDITPSTNGFLLRGRYINGNNTFSYKYLKDTGNGLTVEEILPSVGTSEYRKFEWRLVGTSDYGISTSYTYRELGSYFSVSSIQMYVEDSRTPVINKYPSAALWADPSDFVFVENGNESRLEISDSTIVGKMPGSATVTATHKVTGRSKTFSVSVSILPLSGSEIVADYDNWNDPQTPVWKKTNCYAYALNAQLDPDTGQLWASNSIIQPGAHSSSPQSNATSLGIVANVTSDAAYWGISFSPISRETACPSGSYKIAIVLSVDGFYHFYRQNSDGTWSHKRGFYANTSNQDASYKTIYDPQFANRNHSKNYSIFVGYYAIQPLNLLYSGARTSVNDLNSVIIMADCCQNQF